MALLSQVVHIPVNGGRDGKTDEKLLDPPAMPELLNGMFTEGGAVVKRPGYDVLKREVVGASDLSSAAALASYGSERVLFDAGKLYSYSEGLEKWVDRGTVPQLGVTRTPVVRNTDQQTRADFGLSSGIAVYAWEDSRGGVRCQVVDHATGAVFQEDVSCNASGERPRVVKAGDSLFILYVVTATLYQREIDPTDPATLGAETTMVTDVDDATPNFDVVSRGTDALFAYQTTSNTITVAYLSDEGAVGNLLNGLPNPVTESVDGSSCIGIAYDSTNGYVYVAYHNTTDGVQCFAYDQDLLTQVFASVQLDSETTAMDAISGAVESSTVIRWFYEQNASNDWDHLVKHNTVSDAGSAGTATTLARSVGLASHAFVISGASYVGLVHASTLQATYFLVDNAGTILARHLAGVAGGLPGVPSLPSMVQGVDDTDQWCWAAIEKTKFVSEVDEDNDNVTYSRTGVTLSCWDFSPSEQYRTSQIGGALFISGGVLKQYDGRAPVELGFHLYPENLTVGQTASGGSMSDGTYGWAVIYQWTDKQGNVHRSAPALGSITLSGGGSAQEINFTIPTLRVTDKTDVTIEVYTTEAGGTIYYRVTSTASPLENDTTVDSVTFDRTAADASITSNEILYTQGGILEHVPPPPVAAMTVAKNRLWVVDAEDRTRVWYSKPFVRGEGIAFSDFLTIRADSEGGDLTALFEMDGIVLLFKRNDILAVAGTPANAAGLGQSIQDPRLVTTDVGCDNQASLVRADLGVFFKTTKGIYLLTRGLQANYVGAGVEDLNDQTVSSAVLVEDQNQVRFTHSDGDAVVYDYLFRTWARWDNFTAVGAVVHDGTYQHLKSNGKLGVETPGVYRDENVAIRMSLTTAWIKLAGLLGFQRVRRVAVLGDYRASHKLRVSFGYDYQPYFLDSADWDPDSVIDASVWGSEATWGDAAVWGGVEDGVYDFQVHLQRQKCKAMRVKFEDVSGTDEGFSLSGFALEAAVIPKLDRVRAGKKVSMT